MCRAISMRWLCPVHAICQHIMLLGNSLAVTNPRTACGDSVGVARFFQFACQRRGKVGQLFASVCDIVVVGDCASGF